MRRRIDRQTAIIDELDRLGGRSLRRARSAYKSQTVGPLVAAVKGVAEGPRTSNVNNLKRLLAVLGVGLFAKMKADALADELALAMLLAEGVGIAAATPKEQTGPQITQISQSGGQEAEGPLVAHSISVLTKADFGHRTFDEAEKFFDRKTALTSEQFEALSKLNQARAFRIAGVHKARMIQRARDIVSRGARDGVKFARIRRQLLQLFDVSGLPKPSLGHLQVVYRQNLLHSYAAARVRTLKQPHIEKIFRYWRYLTVGNGQPGVNNVRHEHAVLHGKVFTSTDPFWRHFTPPWEWGCRCYFVALSAKTVQRRGSIVWTYKGGRIRPLGKLKADGEPGKTGRDRKAIKIKPHPDFDHPRDTFDEGQFDLSKLDAEIKRALVKNWG